MLSILHKMSALSLLKQYESPPTSSPVRTIVIETQSQLESVSKPFHNSGWTPTTEKKMAQFSFDKGSSVPVRALTYHQLNDNTPTSKYISLSDNTDTATALVVPDTAPVGPPRALCGNGSPDNSPDDDSQSVPYEGWQYDAIDTFEKLVSMGVLNKFGYTK